MLRTITLCLTFLAYTHAQDAAVVYVFDPTGASGVTGEIKFTKSGSEITVNGTVKGLTPGQHGFHIHNLGKISGGCTETGPHFNPHNLTHGAPEDKIRHVGDLGNIVADNTGLASFEIKDSIISFSGVTNIIGRAVVVHAGVDDLGKGGNEDSLTTGNAGGRVACGVIGILSGTARSSPSSLTILLITLLVIAKSFWG